MTQPQDFDSFLRKYVNTNIAPGSKPYDREFLVDDLLKGLNQEDKTCSGKMSFNVLESAISEKIS